MTTPPRPTSAMIRLRLTTRDRLKAAKRYRNESYDELIERLLDATQKASTGTNAD